MNCPVLTDEQVNYFVKQVMADDELVNGVLSFIEHEVQGKLASIESLAQNMGKSRRVAERVFYLLAGMLLIDYSLGGMPRRYSAVLNENGRRVVRGLIRDENNPNGVLEITKEGVKKVERL